MKRNCDYLKELKTICEEAVTLSFLNPVEVEKGGAPEDWFNPEDLQARIRQLKHFAEMNYHDSVMFGIQDLINDIESDKVKADKRIVEVLTKMMDLVREGALAGKPWWRPVQEMFKKMLGEDVEIDSIGKKLRGEQYWTPETLEKGEGYIRAHYKEPKERVVRGLMQRFKVDREHAEQFYDDIMYKLRSKYKLSSERVILSQDDKLTPEEEILTTLYYQNGKDSVGFAEREKRKVIDKLVDAGLVNWMPRKGGGSPFHDDFKLTSKGWKEAKRIVKEKGFEEAVEDVFDEDIESISLEDMTEYFGFLDGLREVGAVNMFGAGPYLAKAFKIDQKTAQKVLAKWMETFDKHKSAEDRAKMVVKEVR